MRPENTIAPENVVRRKRKPRKSGRIAANLGKTKLSRESSAKIKNRLGLICPICLDHIAKGAISSTICGHIFCTECIKRAVRCKKDCPTCRRHLTGAHGYHPLYLDDTITAPMDPTS